MGSCLLLIMGVTSVFVFLLTAALCDNVRTNAQNFEDSLIVAIEDFTQETYIHLANTFQDKNFVFSPLSLHSALSMVYFGTADNSTTQSELQTALGGLVSEQLVKPLYKQLVKDFKSRKSIFYGNHLWVENNFDLKEPYRRLISDHMNAKLSNADFNSEDTKDVVNSWVENLTNGKIKRLVEDFSPDTQMFLANALYFKENWRFPFDELDTTGNKLMEDFHYKDSESVPVGMMQLVSQYVEYEEFDFPQGQSFSVVKIPYEDKNFEMKIILPKTGERHLDLNLLEAELNLTWTMDMTRENNFLRVNTTKLNFSEVNLMMPKFTVRTKFQAKQLFEKLGAKEIFTREAQMDKITDSGPLGISDILHESVVEVTRDGTEGAAATGNKVISENTITLSRY